MSRRKPPKKLFFSRTLDFLDHYLPEQAKKSHTGIGLNLAELVIKKHFGVIEAYNHENGGAVFSVLLPSYGLKNEKLTFS